MCGTEERGTEGQKNEQKPGGGWRDLSVVPETWNGEISQESMCMTLAEMPNNVDM